MKRTGTMVLLGVVALGGCQNMGLYDAGPEAEAVVAPPTALVASVYGVAEAEAGRPLIVDGRKWVPSGSPVALGEQEVRPVGSAAGQTVFARGWDQAPYDALFVRGDGDRWLTYLPVLGGGSAAASGSSAGGGSSGAPAEGGAAPGH